MLVKRKQFAETFVTGRDVTCRMRFSAYEGCNIDLSEFKRNCRFAAKDVMDPIILYCR